MELFQRTTQPGGKMFRCKHHCTVAIVATATPETATACHFPAPHPTATTTSTWNKTKLIGPGGEAVWYAQRQRTAQTYDGDSKR
jgi:hypothetical protein